MWDRFRIDVESLILFLLLGGLFTAAVPKVVALIKDDGSTVPAPGASWPWGDGAWWRFMRGYPTVYLSIWALIPLLGFKGFGILEDDPILALTRVFGVVGVMGCFLAILVALTGKPEFLIPRSLRLGGSQAHFLSV
jgi:hypothetical protein